MEMHGACRLSTKEYIGPVPAFEIFRIDALTHGYADRLNTSYRVICEKIEGLYIGYTNKANRTISINPRYLNMPKYVEFVMMHECGHYFFDMKHGDNFIMTDALDNNIVLEYMQNRRFYIDQFFCLNNSQIINYLSSDKEGINSSNKLKCTIRK